MLAPWQDPKYFETWSACPLEPSIVLRWFECHPGLGNWLAGIGTLAAVILALGLHFHRVRIEENREKQAARRLAVKIAPQLRNLAGAAESASEAGNVSDFGLNLLPMTVDGLRQQFLFNHDLPFDEEITLLPEAAIESITRVQAFLWRYEAFVENNMANLRSMNGRARAEYIKDAAGVFTGLAIEARNAADIVTEIENS